MFLGRTFFSMGFQFLSELALGSIQTKKQLKLTKK